MNPIFLLFIKKFFLKLYGRPYIVHFGNIVTLFDVIIRFPRIFTFGAFFVDNYFEMPPDISYGLQECPCHTADIIQELFDEYELLDDEENYEDGWPAVQACLEPHDIDSILNEDELIS